MPRQRENGQGSLFKRGRRWSLQYYSAGRRIVESTGTTDRVAAQQLLTQRLCAVSKGEAVSAHQYNCQQLYDHKLKYFKGRRLTRDAPSLWRNLQKFFGNMPARRVTPAVVMEFRAQQAARGLAVGSINRHVALLKSLFRQAHQDGMIGHVPYFYQPKENNTRTGFVKDSKVDELREAAAHVGLWMRTFVEIGVSYGWRLNTIISLTVGQCDFEAEVVRLEPGTTKNKEGVEAPMTPMLRQLLSQCCHGKQPSDGVLTRDDGSQVLYPQRAWHRLCVATNLGTFICRSCHQPSHQQGRCSKCNVNDWGYKGLLVHDLRRTAARRLIRAGVSEVVAMQITGHKTRSMFQRYNITVMEDKRDAMAKLQRADAKWSRAAQPSKVDGSLTTAAPSKRTTVQ